MTLFWILLGLLGLTAVLICYSACVVSSRENYVPRDYYEAVIQELCRKHTEEIASMPDIVRCKECVYWDRTVVGHTAGGKDVGDRLCRRHLRWTMECDWCSSSKAINIMDQDTDCSWK